MPFEWQDAVLALWALRAQATADNASQLSANSATPSNLVPQPVAVADPGSLLLYSRGDHSHAHGINTGGSLHSLVTSLSAGFMSSADFDKLATITSDFIAALSGTNGSPSGVNRYVTNSDPRLTSSSIETRSLLQINNINTDGLTSTFQVTSGSVGLGANVSYAAAGSRLMVLPGDSIVVRGACRANPSLKNVEIRIFTFSETLAMSAGGAAVPWVNSGSGIDIIPGTPAGTWVESSSPYVVPSGVFAITLGARVTVAPALLTETIFAYAKRTS